MTPAFTFLKREKSMPRSLTVAVLITLYGGLLTIAQTDVSGTWTLTIDAGQGANDTPLVLEQDGDMLKGTAGAADTEAPVEGTITGNDITMTHEIDAPQVGPMTLSFTGMVDGSNMKGTVDFGGFASGSWTAVKN